MIPLFHPPKQETWRIISEFPNYEVSDMGRVRRRTPGPATYVGKILSPILDPYGYHGVNLCNDQTRRTVMIHQLVYKTFVGTLCQDKSIHHEDGNKLNNGLGNLIEMKKFSHIGLHSRSRINPFSGRSHSIESRRKISVACRGERHSKAKINESDVKEIRGKLAEGKLTMVAIADSFNVSPNCINNIKRGVNWRHVQ
ncbi:MAG: NUMOD4 motif-containing HNH endonuclease [Desulfobacterales bacterium]|nr:NUMOD4 motif-containing HNH endonuclease [Desulfobacterales bacterium]